MDEFNFDDYLDIVDVPVPEDTTQRDALPIPAGAIWAEHDYKYAELKAMDHLTVVAFHITHAELKHIDTRWGNLIVLQSHVGEQKVWQIRDDGKFNKFFGLVATVLQQKPNEAFVWEEDFVLLRQTIQYETYKTCQWQGFYRPGEAENIEGFVYNKTTWYEKQSNYAEGKALASYERSQRYGGMYPEDGHPDYYGDK